jgi:ABC-2 type transport system ATP-binding protein
MEEADSLCSRVAIMHAGKVVVIGTPEELKNSIGRSGTTLDDVFVHYAGDSLESGGNFRETASERRMAKRLS